MCVLQEWRGSAGDGRGGEGGCDGGTGGEGGDDGGRSGGSEGDGGRGGGGRRPNLSAGYNSYPTAADAHTHTRTQAVSSPIPLYRYHTTVA